jgi:hypothetical protein
MTTKPPAAATMFLALGAATIWLMHVQEAANLIKQSTEPISNQNDQYLRVEPTRS